MPSEQIRAIRVIGFKSALGLAVAEPSRPRCQILRHGCLVEAHCADERHVRQHATPEGPAELVLQNGLVLLDGPRVQVVV